MNTTQAHPNPAVQRRRWWILAILSLSVFLAVVDNLIINVALPTLARELGATTSGLQWIVDSYALVFAGLLLACERGEGDVDDQVVDHREEHREAEDREDPPASALHGGVGVGL
ncbi:MAG: MFS transporter, partial [Acidimicrobiales bacterium]